jgi:probable rRNA maturation factor
LNRIALCRRGRATKTDAATCRLLVRRLGRAMRAAGLDGVELSLTLSDDRELHALNREFAGEDHATDVLSFAQREGARIVHAGREPIGDVVISVEYAKKQAASLGRTLPGELFHLAVHGLVHLLGYDHRDPAEERVMFGYETKLRAAALSAGTPKKIIAPRRGRAAPPSASPRRPRAPRGRGRAVRSARRGR